ncbi:MAG: hypothetical protein OXT09_27495 [Myxococcales bacterium]|nr:hypothetical protein [Myxococcales bacterium]
MRLRIGIVGDFARGFHSHWATEAALFHAATRLDLSVEPDWIATPTVLEPDGIERLATFDGLWGAPGSPFASALGMLRAIQYARERDVPYLGTCAGFQYALIEFTRNVLGIADADSVENDPDGRNVVIRPLSCEVPANRLALAGLHNVQPLKSTRLAALCGDEPLRAEFFCSMEPNVEFIERWERAGLRIAAHGPDGEMRAFELPGHRFFLATLHAAPGFERVCLQGTVRKALAEAVEVPEIVVAGADARLTEVDQPGQCTLLTCEQVFHTGIPVDDGIRNGFAIREAQHVWQCALEIRRVVQAHDSLCDRVKIQSLGFESQTEPGLRLDRAMEARERAANRTGEAFAARCDWALRHQALSRAEAALQSEEPMVDRRCCARPCLWRGLRSTGGWWRTRTRGGPSSLQEGFEYLDVLWR